MPLLNPNKKTKIFYFTLATPLLFVIFFVFSFSLYASNGRSHAKDPTRPPGYYESEGVVTSGGADKLELNAIFISDKSRIAMINGLLLKVGDKVNGKVLSKIEGDHVVLSGDEGDLDLYLHERLNITLSNHE